MPARLLGIFGATALVASTSLFSTAHAQADRVEPAAALIQPWESGEQPGVAVALSIDGEIIFAQGAGLANLEHERPITPDTPFQVASVSKQFTTFATLLLVSDGTLALEDDVRRLIPELDHLPYPITVAHLIDHASGLREIANLTAMSGLLNDDIRTQDLILDLIYRQRGVNFEAGTDTAYNNSGYILLAEIVTRVSGQSFQDFTQERIFTPLGMTNTRFPENRNQVIPGRAESYYPTGDGFNRVIAANGHYGSTGLYTTANDLLLWAENFRTGTVGNDDVFEMMEERFTAPNGAYSTFARGQEYRVYNGLETWSHGGQDAGFRSFLLRVPEHDFALSIVSNRTDFDTAALAFALVDTYLADVDDYVPAQTADWAVADQSTLRSFEGNYEIYPGLIMSFAAMDDGLGFRMGVEDSTEFVPLPQVGERRFMLNSARDISVEFAPIEGDRSPGVDYVIGLNGRLPGERIYLPSLPDGHSNLGDFVGVYESDEVATAYAVTLTDGQLTVTHVRTGSFPLVPMMPDVFTGAESALHKLEFHRDETGEVIGFLASTQIAHDVEFVRR